MPTLQRLTFSSLLISLSLILSRIEISVFFSFGGSITLFSLVPIIIISLKYKYTWGALSGGVFGILHLLTTNIKFQGLCLSSVIISIFLDYIAANTVIGLTSYFEHKFNNFKYSLQIGVILSFSLKLLIHTLSGIIVWTPFFKQYSINLIIYAILYNASFIIPEMLISLLGISIVKKLLPKLFNNN